MIVNRHFLKTNHNNLKKKKLTIQKWIKKRDKKTQSE